MSTVRTGWRMSAVGLAVGVGAAVSVRAAIGVPTDVGGCVLWLDASDASSVVLTDGRVSEWQDKSGNRGTVSQADEAKRPVAGVTTLNGRNTMTFEGGKWLGGPPVLQQGDDTFSYFAVWQRLYTNAVAQVVFEQSQSPQATGTRASLLTTGDRYGFYGQSNDIKLGSFTPGEWKLTGMEVDGRATRNVQVYDNAVFYAGAVNITTQNVGTNGTRVAAKLVNSGENLIGTIAEILVYDRVLSDSDRNAVLYYLQQKWGLDCGHRDVAMLVDFEHDCFPEGWVTNGDAFVTQPVCSTRAAFNNRGDWLVGTYDKDKNGGTSAQGDFPTGTLTGTSFVLSNNTIRARVGGGYWVGAGQECQLQLERESAPGVWQVVRKATGPNGETMREIRWNCSGLIGQTVRFKMVDNYAGTWGQVSADDLRVLDEPMPRALTADFSGTDLPPALIAQRPYQSPEVALTGTGTVRLALLSGTHDIWSAADRGPKVLLNTVDNDAFTLETHLVSRTYTNASNMAGLILMFEEPDANTFDCVMFGAHRDGLIIQGPSVASTNALPGVITDVRLRVKGWGDRFTYEYSTDGADWVTVRTDNLPGKVLLHAGLFCKDWSAASALAVEFDYLGYQAAPIPKGTCILVL